MAETNDRRVGAGMSGRTCNAREGTEASPRRLNRKAIAVAIQLMFAQPLLVWHAESDAQSSCAVDSQDAMEGVNDSAAPIANQPADDDVDTPAASSGGAAAAIDESLGGSQGGDLNDGAAPPAACRALTVMAASCPRRAASAPAPRPALPLTRVRH